MGDAKGELGNLDITVTLDKEKKTITISDKGVGMKAPITGLIGAKQVSMMRSSNGTWLFTASLNSFSKIISSLCSIASACFIR